MTLRWIIHQKLPRYCDQLQSNNNSSIMSRRTNICILVLVAYIVVFSIFLRPEEADEGVNRRVGRRHVLTADYDAGENLDSRKKGDADDISQVVDSGKGGAMAPGAPVSRNTDRFNKQIPKGDYFQHNRGTIATKYDADREALEKVIKYDDADNNLMLTSDWSSSADLSRALSRYQYNDMMSLVENIHALLSEKGITHVMWGSTLAGSYIFHDLIPWLDTAEFMLDFRDIDKVFHTFSNANLRSEYEIVSLGDPVDWFSLPMLLHEDPIWDNPKLIKSHQKQSSYKFRLFRKEDTAFSQKGQHHSSQWPYIDFSFFNVTEEPHGHLPYIYQVDASNPHRIFHVYSDFFPVHMRPLGHHWMPAPNHVRKVLRQTNPEGDFQCQGRHIDSVRQKQLRQSKVSCERVVGVYGHVDRQNVEGGVRETMVMSKRPVHTVWVPEPHSDLEKAAHKYSVR